MFDALEKRFKKDGYESSKDLINELYQGNMKDYVKCLEVGTAECASLQQWLGTTRLHMFLLGVWYSTVPADLPYWYCLSYSYNVYLSLSLSLSQCGYESAREDSFLDIPLVIKPFGSTTTHESVVSALLWLSVTLQILIDLL